jgi:hypothetical protein
MRCNQDLGDVASEGSGTEFPQRPTLSQPVMAMIQRNLMTL